MRHPLAALGDMEHTRVVGLIGCVPTWVNGLYCTPTPQDRY